jgi:hypothetical protein
MYCKKMETMPGLPEDLKKDLVEEATRIFETQKENRILYHRRFDNEDKNTLNYIEKEDMDFYEQSGGVSCMAMNSDLERRLFDFFKQANHPITNEFGYFGFLYVEGGPYCAPHIDDVERRRNGFQLLLKSGGDNTTTAWWEPKEEYKDSTVIDYSGIPYSKLDLAYEEQLKENYWYWMKFDSIHSVEKLETLRIFLASGIEGKGDIKYLIDYE